jgi:aryl-alcohol dehydrogenase-like predicted oxidoreductase
VQVIYNMLRQRPAELLFSQAIRRRVGVLARLPLSSGLLTGKLSAASTFAADDHRHFNREGAGFDRGETFSGIEFTAGLAAVEALRPLVPPGMSMAQMAIRWIQANPAVTCSIPGCRRPAQVEENMAAADLPELHDETMDAVSEIYARHAKPLVHARW